jgi:hypothetical protein
MRRIGRLGLAASLGQAAWATQRQWQQMPRRRRARLQALVRQSGGRPSRLSAAERRELWGLIGDLNLGEVLRAGATNASGRGFGRRVL